MIGYTDWVASITEATTRIAAHNEIKPSKSLLQAQVIGLLEAYGPMTCDEVEALGHLNHQTASPRFTELRNAGRIVDTGERRRTRSGRRATVWRVVK